MIVIRPDRVPGGEHARRYNAPTCDEIAVVISGEEFGRRDIILHQKDGMMRRVGSTHRSYDCLQYPLMFPRGEDGYHFNIPHHNQNSNARHKKVSAKEFYAQRIMTREEQNHILFCRTLFQQYLVDMYAKMPIHQENESENSPICLVLQFGRCVDH